MSSDTFLKLPEWINTEVWNGFSEMREVMWKSKRIPWTERARQIALTRLAKFHSEGFDVNYMLDEAVLKGWRWPFPNDGTPRVARQAQTTTPERAAEILQQIERQRAAARTH